MATPVYLSTRIKNTSRITKQSEVKSLIKSSFHLIENEISKLQEQLADIKATQDYISSPASIQSQLTDKVSKTLHTEKRRLVWYTPFYNAALDAENGIISLLTKLFKSHECEWCNLFHDLYSLAKLHQIMIGRVAYCPTDANTNVLALVEYIVVCKGKNFRNGSFFTFYNDIKMERQEILIADGYKLKRKQRDTTLTQTGKIFRTCAKLGIGKLSSSPDSKTTPCMFSINWDSILLAEIASKPSQGELRALIATHGTKTQ